MAMSDLGGWDSGDRPAVYFHNIPQGLIKVYIA